MPGLVKPIDSGHGRHERVSAFGVVNGFSQRVSLRQKLERFVLTLDLTGLFIIDIVEASGELYFVEIHFRFAANGYAVSQAVSISQQ